MKRISFFIVLAVIAFAINFATADNHPLASDYSNIEDILYLENGNILYSRYDGDDNLPRAERVLNKIICINSSGNQIWECEIPTCIYSPFSNLIETNDECFIYLGQRIENLYSLMTISKTGQLIKEYIFPNGILSPMLLSDGVLYISSEERRIEKQFWDGTITSPELLQSFDRIDMAETIQNYTYVSAISNHELFLFCIDESGKETWKYLLGKSEEIFLQAWCSLDNNNLTVAYQINIPNQNTSVCLMEICNGEKKWETPLTWLNEIIRMQLLLPDKGNGYELYGRINDEQGFCLSISKEGKTTKCITVNVPIVDFVQYNGSVYAIGYDINNSFSPNLFIDYSLLNKQSYLY